MRTTNLKWLFLLIAVTVLTACARLQPPQLPASTAPTGEGWKNY